MHESFVEHAVPGEVPRSVEEATAVHTQEHARRDALYQQLSGPHRVPLEDGIIAPIVVGTVDGSIREDL